MFDKAYFESNKAYSTPFIRILPPHARGKYITNQLNNSMMAIPDILYHDGGGLT